MAPTSGEDSDLVQWAFDTLVSSYEAYHGEDCEGKQTRPLRGFASQMPQLISVAPPPTRPTTSSSLFVRGLGGGSTAASSRKQKRGEPQPQQEPIEPQSDSLNFTASRNDIQSGNVKGERIGRGIESRRVNPKSDVPASERGPMPPPFGNPDPSKSSVQQTDREDVEGEMPEEPQTPEEYAVWMQYYQQCADYFKQCEAAMATKAGVQLPDNATIPPPVASTTAVPSSQVPASSSISSGPKDKTTPPAPYAASLHGSVSPYPGDSIAAHHNISSVHGAPFSGYGGLQERVGYGGVGTGHFGHIANPMSPPGTSLQGVNLAHMSNSGHVPSSPGSALLGSYSGSGGLPVLPGLSLGRSGALGGSPQNFGTDEELGNLLMAWYWSGYHTGHFAARQGR